MVCCFLPNIPEFIKGKLFESDNKKYHWITYFYKIVSSVETTPYNHYW